MKRSSVYIRPLLIIAVVVATLVSSSCRRQPTAAYTALLDAERLLVTSEGFDSGLVIFNSVDSAALRGDEHYLRDLLQAEINYKSYIDETDDSVIHAAAIYFDDINDRPRFVRAKLIEGNIRFNAGDYNNSMLSALEGFSVAQSLKDTLYMARLSELIAYDYHITGNKKAYLEQMKESSDLYSYTDRRQTYIANRIGVALAYIDNNMYEQAISLCDSLIPLCHKDSLLLGSILRTRISPFVHMHRYEDAKKAVEQYLPFRSWAPLTSFEYSHIALINVNDQDYKLAWDNLEKARERISWRGDDYTYLDALKVYYSSIGDINALCEILQTCLSKINQTFGEIMEQSMMRVERDFYNEIAEKEHSQAQKLKKHLFFGSISALIIIISLLIIHRINISRKNRIIENGLAILQELPEIQPVAENDNNEKLRQLKILTDTLFQENFSMINQLGNEYFHLEANSKSKNDILEKVRAIIDSITSPAQVLLVRDGLNQIYDHLIDRLEEQIPALTKNEIDFLTFFFAGFEPRVICVLMKIQLGNFYNHRSRTKAKIEKSDAPDKETFLKPFRPKNQS